MLKLGELNVIQVMAISAVIVIIILLACLYLGGNEDLAMEDWNEYDLVERIYK